MTTKTHRKPTRAKRTTAKTDTAGHDLRIEAVYRLIQKGHHDGEIKRMMAQQTGVATRTVERYLRRARELIRERLGRGLEEHKGEAIAFYEGVIRDAGAKPRDKILARSRIDDILGLDAPKRHALGGDSSAPPIKTETTAIDARDAIKAIAVDEAGVEALKLMTERSAGVRIPTRKGAHA